MAVKYRHNYASRENTKRVKIVSPFFPPSPSPSHSQVASFLFFAYVTEIFFTVCAPFGNDREKITTAGLAFFEHASS